MASNTIPASPTLGERSSSDLSSHSKQRLVGGPLRRGMERLIRSLERKVDDQILAAQVRAYDSKPFSSGQAE